MLRIVMAVSADGFVARGTYDDMQWTGREDKRLFRELTTTRGGVLGVGSTTYAAMPKALPGRTLVPLSSRGLLEASMTLGDFARAHPTGWLIGGQTVALVALSAGLVDRVYLFRNSTALGTGIADRVSPFLYSARWRMHNYTDHETVRVDEWHWPGHGWRA